MANEHVFRRYEGNPIVTPAAVPTANTIFNSAAVKFKDGYAGVFRVDTTSMSAGLHVGRSADGLTWELEPDPVRFEVGPEAGPEPMHGNHFLYDPRIAQIDGVYYVTWCHYPHGPRGGGAPAIGLASTTDFARFTLIDADILYMNRNGVLFPRKIKGQYAILHRPSNQGHTPFGDVYFAESPDLVHWGRHRFVFGPRGGWQSTKVGAGPAPMETDEGWLMLYHGVRTSCSGFIYCMGGALLDLDEPWKVLYRTKPYLLAPTEDYERMGDVPNVVFPTAALLDEASGDLTVYYGCADTVLSVAYAKLDDVIAFIKGNSF